jgi:hypothetical protein
MQKLARKGHIKLLPKCSPKEGKPPASKLRLGMKYVEMLPLPCSAEDDAKLEQALLRAGIFPTVLIDKDRNIIDGARAYRIAVKHNMMNRLRVEMFALHTEDDKVSWRCEERMAPSKNRNWCRGS